MIKSGCARMMDGDAAAKRTICRIGECVLL